MLTRPITRPLTRPITRPLVRQSSVFDPLTLFAQGQQGAWYDPSDLATLFQDAAGTIPVTADGDPVGLMLDKSGNGHHASQSTTAAKPVYRTDGMLHWLEFDGVDDYMASPAVLDGPDFMFVTGMQTVAPADAFQAYWSFGGRVFRRRNDPGGAGLEWNVQAGGSNLYDPSVPGSQDIVCRINHTNANAGMYVDGVNTANFTPSITLTLLDEFEMGRNSSAEDNYAGYRMYTFIAVTGDPGTEIASDADEYVAAKSGVSL